MTKQTTTSESTLDDASTCNETPPKEDEVSLVNRRPPTEKEVATTLELLDLLRDIVGDHSEYAGALLEFMDEFDHGEPDFFVVIDPDFRSFAGWAHGWISGFIEALGVPKYAFLRDVGGIGADELAEFERRRGVACGPEVTERGATNSST